MKQCASPAKKFSHKQCYSAKENHIKGNYYICSLCVDSITSKHSTAPDTKEEKDIEDLNLTSLTVRKESVSSSGSGESDDGIQPGQSSPRNQDDEERQKNDDAHKESENQICPLYLEAKCPHGLRGRNCGLEHPRRCRRYCSFGTEYRTGCRRGKNCWFWHPKICLNSAKLKICLNQSCKDVHLKGTQRRQVPKDHFKQRDRAERESVQTQRPDPWSQSSNSSSNNSKTNPEMSRVQSTRTNDQNDFLFKHLEQMKADLQTSMSLKLDQIDHKNQMLIQQTFHSLQHQTPQHIQQQMPQQQMPQQQMPQQQMPQVYIQRHPA